MKKKILILTSIYPGKNISKDFTPVVHYFAKEWIKMGHEVITIHNVAYYPRLFYFLSALFSKLIASYTGTNIPVKRIDEKIEYILEGVKVFRLPMFKKKPHSKFSKKVIQKQVSSIQEIVDEISFQPDVIVGHWVNPQLELIYELKKNNKKSITSMVMHSSGESLLKLYPNNYKQLVQSIDVWGFRSQPIKVNFKNIFGEQKNIFMCYSGIPKEYTELNTVKRFNKTLNSFIYVGTLIKRKYPDQIIEALALSNYKDNFLLNYVGHGNESKKIVNQIKNKCYSNNVKLLGRVTRNEVQILLQNSDCFIMISENEAYGLVYLEAMAAGCITIASRGEGFDGVIKDGVNGFLCEAGNANELSEILNKINLLSTEEKTAISTKAMETAKNLTDFNAAKMYIDNLTLH
jgi:glycosyltransferase involved in cell wall biosynthesis